ncbi:hypothetical protein [Frankia sp. Cppng1_Ct_nod]|uniref:hypothetical protein n=1 Tax=Frankia sp. Cppng1_Ct_nod TaxID=2897162 RepID=UPI001A9507DB|nr:hypothetical protein [Frankia sp. Cppng1_Ct_nod]
MISTGAALLRAPHPPSPLLEAVSCQILGETRSSTALDLLAAIDAQHRGRFCFNQIAKPTGQG